MKEDVHDDDVLVSISLCNLSVCLSQFVIGEDGGCGSLLEHSTSDGPASIAANLFAIQLMHTLVPSCDH